MKYLQMLTTHVVLSLPIVFISVFINRLQKEGVI